MTNKSLPYLIIALLILFIAGSFYWFSYKPKQIREKCYAEAEFDQRAITNPDDASRSRFINQYYSDCLKRFGVKE